ncbi:tetratricopeptide (TPR) repeat protein [Streptomyces sp. SAI-126]
MARPVLRLLAVLAEAPVPLSLITPDLLSAVTGDDVTVPGLEAAFAGLHRYGLLDLPHSPGNAGQASGISDPAQVVLHPLIREINAVALAAGASHLATWQRALAERLTAAVHEVDEQGRAGWPAAVLLAPHLPMLLDLPDPCFSAHHRTALGTLAQVLEHAGAFGAARLLQERLLDFESRTLGPQHPDTLTSRNHLANALFGMGEPVEAILLLRQTLEDRSRVLGPAHPDTLISRHDLACALDGTGQHAEAVSLLRHTLADRARVLGVLHPHTLASRDSLGLALDGMGEHAEAVRLHRQTVDDRIRVLGLNHPDTLTSRHNLASALARMGEQEEAVRLRDRPSLTASVCWALSTRTPCAPATTWRQLRLPGVLHDGDRPGCAPRDARSRPHRHLVGPARDFVRAEHCVVDAVAFHAAVTTDLPALHAGEDVLDAGSDLAVGGVVFLFPVLESGLTGSRRCGMTRPVPR